MHFIYELNRRFRVVRQSLGKQEGQQMYVLGLLFLLLMVLHVIAMMVFEEMTLGDSVWLTITTATTVGYGDYSAVSTAGRVATIVLMYLGGIFVLAQLGSMVFELSAEKRDKRLSGKLSLKVQDHIVIFGWRQNYLIDLINEMRRSMAPLHDAKIVIISENDTTLPEEMRDQGIQHVVGPYHEDDTFEKAVLKEAAAVVVIPEQSRPSSDFVTIDLMERLAEYDIEAPIIAELLDSKLLPQAKRAGAAHLQLFNPNYPDMLARSILAPGSEALFDEIIKDSKTEMVVLHLPIQRTVQEVRDAVHEMATLLAYQDKDDIYHLYPEDSKLLLDNPLIFLIDTAAYGGTTGARKALEERLQPLADERKIDRFRVPRSVGLLSSSQRATEDYRLRLQEELGEECQLVPLAQDGWSQSLEVERLQQQDAILLLADDPQQPEADAKTYVTIRHLREELGYKGRLITEAVLASNRERFARSGASDVIRPVTQNMEILARCILTGAEEVLDNLFSSERQEVLRLKHNGQRLWSEVVQQLGTLGLPLGYEDTDGEVHTLPSESEQCQLQAVYLLVDRERYEDFDKLQKTVEHKLTPG